MRKVFIMGKLKLQYCAILSQIHRHKDALEQAREGVKVCHQLITDMYQLCQFYVNRERVNTQYQETSTQQDQLNDYSSRFENQKSKNGSNSSRNRSFSNFLNNNSDAYKGFESFSMSVNQNHSLLSAQSKNTR
jgi:hypothetical protein